MIVTYIMADFEYWLRQDLEDVEARDSLSEVVERVESFRNENIIEQYREKAEDSLKFDPEGELSKLGEPTVRMDLTAESPILTSVREDEQDLGNNEGAVMHSYNIGLGVGEAVENTLSGLEAYDVSDPVLEIVDQGPVNSVYQENYSRNAVKELKEKTAEMGAPTAEAIALGLISSYHE
jgi:predicted DNA-binding protein